MFVTVQMAGTSGTYNISYSTSKVLPDIGQIPSLCALHFDPFHELLITKKDSNLFVHGFLSLLFCSFTVSRVCVCVSILNCHIYILYIYVYYSIDSMLFTVSIYLFYILFIYYLFLFDIL